MDFMFEDEVDEVGSDVEAYCPKCKADTTHVVISKYEDEIRRVQCNPCGDVHSFRKPRGEVEDDVPEPIAAKKRAMLKKLNWDEFFAKHGEKHGKPYEFREHYSENAIVTHPKFGRGFVSEVMSDSKVEITFKDARRVLVHNRKDMPGLPLAAEGDGIPSKGPKAKAVKNKAAKDAKDDKQAAKASAPPLAKATGKAEPSKSAKDGPTKAKTADGKTVDGKTIDGKTIDGKTIDGKTIDGKKPGKPVAAGISAKAKPVKAEKAKIVRSAKPAKAKPVAKTKKSASKPSKPAKKRHQ
jgi:hypothetical protein